MKKNSNYEPTELVKKGLNLHYVFELDQLPASILLVLKEQHTDLSQFKQLILIAHCGPKLWHCLKENSLLLQQSSNPIDDFTTGSINSWFKQHHPALRKKVIYPSTQLIPLQELGQLAHWHYPSPFLVGINNLHGTWFAYRAAILCNSDFINPTPIKSHSPCNTCQSKVCITQCPAQAISEEAFDMNACLHYRKQENSLCQHTCLARTACPVGKDHQYSDQQMQYHYGVSLKMILNVK